MPLRAFEAALAAEGVPLGVSYPGALADLELFRSGNFAPTRRALGVGERLASSCCPSPSTPPPRRSGWSTASCWPSASVVLRVAEAAARIQEHAAEIMERMPIGAGA